MQVGPVDAGVDDVQARPAELLADVLDDVVGGGGGERQHRRAAERFDRRRHLEVGRAEVVAPLRDAVRFVDHHQRDVDLLENGEEVGVRQPFRRAEDDLVGAVADAFERGLLLVGGEAAVELRGADAELAQLFELVLHQRNQGRDDDRGAAKHLGRDLVAQRFAAAGGHDRQRVFTVEHAVDHLLLAVAQTLDAEHAAQQLGDGVAAHGAQAAVHQEGVMFSHKHNSRSHVTNSP